MFMKKILFSLLAVALTFTSIAQTTTQTENKAAKHHDKEGKIKGEVAKNLNLTSDQKHQLKVINHDYKEQMQTLNSNTNTADIKQQREVLIKDYKQRVDNILTPEQRIKAEQLKRNRPAKANGSVQRNSTIHNKKVLKTNAINP